MKHAAPRTYRTVRTVAMVFVISLLIFGGVMLLPLWWQGRPISPPAAVDTRSGRTRRFTLLFYDGVEGFTGAVVLTTDTAARTAQTVGYSPEYIVSHEGKLSTLAAVFHAHGDVAAAAALEEQTDTATEGPLTFSVSNVAAFVVHLREYLPYTLPENVGDLQAGDVTLTPMQTADILRYDGWENGATGQAHAHASVVAAILNRYLISTRDLQGDFAALTKLCDTRLTVSHFEAARDGLSTLAAANDGTLCTVAAQPH